MLVYRKSEDVLNSSSTLSRSGSACIAWSLHVTLPYTKGNSDDIAHVMNGEGRLSLVLRLAQKASFLSWDGCLCMDINHY
jgi:hypothetical protein